MPKNNEIAIYRRLFDNKYDEIYLVLDGLPDEALRWRPFTESPWRGASGSIGWLVAHAVSSTVYLLRRAEWQAGKRTWDEVQGDEGADAFGVANHEVAYLRARVERTQTLVHAYLDALRDEDLDGMQPNPNVPERPFTVRFDIQHAIEHMSQHIGHAHLTRQLWAL